MKTASLHQAIASNVVRLRVDADWTQQRLAAEVVRLGLSWTRTTVAEVETGRRKVGVVELFILSIAFDYPLVALVSPPDMRSKVQITSEIRMTGRDIVNAVTYGADREARPSLAEVHRLRGDIATLKRWLGTRELSVTQTKDEIDRKVAQLEEAERLMAEEEQK